MPPVVLPVVPLTPPVLERCIDSSRDVLLPEPVPPQLPSQPATNAAMPSAASASRRPVAGRAVVELSVILLLRASPARGDNPVRSGEITGGSAPPAAPRQGRLAVRSLVRLALSVRHNGEPHDASRD